MRIVAGTTESTIMMLEPQVEIVSLPPATESLIQDRLLHLATAWHLGARRTHFASYSDASHSRTQSLAELDDGWFRRRHPRRPLPGSTRRERDWGFEIRACSHHQSTCCHQPLEYVVHHRA